MDITDGETVDSCTGGNSIDEMLKSIGLADNQDVKDLITTVQAQPAAQVAIPHFSDNLNHLFQRNGDIPADDGGDDQGNQAGQQGNNNRGRAHLAGYGIGFLVRYFGKLLVEL